MATQKELIFKAAYILICILCSGLFGINVFVTIRTYLNSETIETSTKIISADQQIHLPLLAICLKNPFKDPKRLMLTLEDFDDNTYPSNDSAALMTLESNTFETNGKLTTWSKEYINSQLFGKCLLYNMNEKVKNSQKCATYFVQEVPSVA